MRLFKRTKLSKYAEIKSAIITNLSAVVAGASSSITINTGTKNLKFTITCTATSINYCRGDLKAQVV